jgi:hypothetical protein
MMNDDLRRTLALTEEVRLAVALLESGLSHLQKIDLANDFYHLPILELASGLERLLKCLLCIERRHATHYFPTRQELPHTHDLGSLLEVVARTCFAREYVNEYPAGRDDLAFIRGNPVLREVLMILSEFGEGNRYHDLDTVLGQPRGDSPEAAWQRMELAILSDQGRIDSLSEPMAIESLYDVVNVRLVALLERLIRALARLFTLADLGDIAKAQTGNIASFLGIRDNQLGQHTY